MLEKENMSRKFVLPGIAVAALAISACGSSSKSSSKTASGASTSAASTSTASTSTSGGAAASGSPIRLGSICSCSGPEAAVIANAGKVITAWANTVNASGGINGHPVKVYVKDD